MGKVKRGPGRPRKIKITKCGPDGKPIKRKPGRPKKEKVESDKPKRGPGRPRKEIELGPKRPPGRPRKEGPLEEQAKAILEPEVLLDELEEAKQVVLPQLDKKSRLEKLADRYVMEYLKCKNDFEYYSRNYVLIEAPGRDILLKPYQKQVELINLLEEMHYVFVLKSRQIGISTIIKAYVSWLTVFYSNAVIGIISKDGKEATDFARDVRGMVEKLPIWMKPPNGSQGQGFQKKTEQSFILTNGSKVFAATVNPNAPDKTLRGKALTFLVIDEAAFIGNIDTAWTSLVPALSTNQMQARKAGVPYGTIILSTPNKTMGVGEWYFKRYMSAVSREDIFEPFVIHWKSIPELADDPSWYKMQCALFDNDPRKIAQELELKFLPAEGSFFDPETVEKVQNSVQKPIEKLKLFGGEIWKFSNPIPNSYYIIGVDTAPEHGNDKSALTIFNYATMEQVAEFQGKCKVLDYVKVIKVVASMYPGLIVVESNSYGNQILEQLESSEYSHMLYKESRGTKTFALGLSNNSKTRPLMIDAVYSYISQYPECIKSERLSLEIAGMVNKKSGRVEADTGCHDDLVLATACVMYVRKYDPPMFIGSQEYTVISQDISDILFDNNDDINTVTNSGIMKHVKDHQSEFNGFVDILSMYSKK